MDLDLSGVELGHHGGIAIASMLQINTSLKHLGLKGADLDTDCIIAMATVLQGNRALRKLDLSRPLLHSHLEESTIHISKALKVGRPAYPHYKLETVFYETGDPCVLSY